MSQGFIKSRILVADDDIVQRALLRMILEGEGYGITEVENGREAFEMLSEDPDLKFLITDLNMPLVDGFELIRNIRNKEVRYTYIIVLSASDGRDSLLKALSLGADDYLQKPVHPEELMLRLKAGERLLKLESHEELIFAMAKLAEYRSPETGYHLERVLHYTRALGRDLARNCPELRITAQEAEEIARLSPLHDIGKVAISDSILKKTGALTKEEYELMKGHTTAGGNLIKEIYEKTGSPYLRLAYEIVLYHHERWDGSGYPRGLAGEEIPLSARIVALADVYDAISSKRCYKAAQSHNRVRASIMEQEGEHFDPRVVAAFLRQEDMFVSIQERFQEQECIDACLSATL